MNTAPATALIAAVLLGGCASRQTKPDEAARHGPFRPAMERPGVGTAWGEQRESWVERAPFTRAGSGRPATEDRLYYNDREGVNAMLDYLGRESKRADGMQLCAGGRLRMALRNGNGEWLECHESKGRRFAVGESGGRYEIVVKNESRRPVEAVVSMDGLDIIDGEAASLKKRGYLLAPFESVAIEGFRTSSSSVAAFRFGSMFESYSHRRHGHATNAGVIGVAVFEEKRGAPRGAAEPGAGAWRHVGARPAPSGARHAVPPEA
ncbi:MAG: hypothetical protein ABMA01_11565 [Chthoniobacteraceae bacterium]